MEIPKQLTNKDLEKMGIDIPAGMQTEDEAKQEQNEIKEQQKLTTSAN